MCTYLYLTPTLPAVEIGCETCPWAYNQKVVADNRKVAGNLGADSHILDSLAAAVHSQQPQEEDIHKQAAAHTLLAGVGHDRTLAVARKLLAAEVRSLQPAEEDIHRQAALLVEAALPLLVLFRSCGNNSAQELGGARQQPNSGNTLVGPHTVHQEVGRRHTLERHTLERHTPIPALALAPSPNA